MNAAPAFLTDSLPPGAAARLAIFGKHPAAADHLEDAGLSTHSLVGFKQTFYVDGLGETLARRRWEKELEGMDYVPYSHGIVCVGPDGWLTGYFNASSDAKGRRQYPLVAAAHMAGFKTAAAAVEIGDIVRQTLRQAEGATTLEGIRAAQVSGQRQLEAGLINASSGAAGASVRLRLLEGSGCGPESDALARVLHSLAPQGAGSGRARVRQSMAVSTFHALLWVALVRSVLALQRQCVCITWQHGDSLADITLGEPSARTVQSLFAPETTVPLTACVPYQIEEQQQDVWDTAVQAWIDAPELLAPPPEESGSVIRSVLRFFRPRSK